MKLGLRSISRCASRPLVNKDREEVPTPLQDVQRHVELRFISGWKADQFALGVGGDDGAISQGESVQRAECVTVPQH